jgi:hypothetical protein
MTTVEKAIKNKNESVNAIVELREYIKACQ